MNINKTQINLPPLLSSDELKTSTKLPKIGKLGSHSITNVPPEGVRHDNSSRIPATDTTPLSQSRKSQSAEFTPIELGNHFIQEVSPKRVLRDIKTKEIKTSLLTPHAPDAPPPSRGASFREKNIKASLKNDSIVSPLPSV
jgi:hypothetical protein